MMLYVVNEIPEMLYARKVLNVEININSDKSQSRHIKGVTAYRNKMKWAQSQRAPATGPVLRFL